jgi:NADH-quinone oxidoreductase subunit M
MSDFPWLTASMVVPLAGAAACAAVPRAQAATAKAVALLTSFVTLAVVIGAAFEFSKDDTGLQLTEEHRWISQFGVSYALGVDGVSLVMILLTAALTPILLLAAWNELDEAEEANDPTSAKPGDAPAARGSVGVYLAMILVLEAMAIGQFAAADVFLFYVLFESMLIPMYYLIGRYGGPQRQYAAVKFLLYNLLGGLIMLVGVVTLYFAGPGGETAYLLSTLTGTGAENNGLETETARWVFLSFFIAFAIKAPLWPFHTWLPDAVAESTPSNAVLLSGILDKVGVFAMLHLCLPLFPEASDWFAPLIVTLAVISIIYGALLAIGQTDMKRLIAYTSVSHYGFIVLGIFVFTTQGGAGATLYMINHGFATAGLMLIAGFMMSRRGSRLISAYGGVQKVAPVLAGTFLFAGLANLSLPGMSTFVSEFMVLMGAFSRYRAAGVVAAVGVLLAALYVLILYQRTMAGELTEGNENTPDLRPREIAVVTPIVVAILALGFFPKPALEVITPAIEATMTSVSKADPVPRHAPGDAVAEPAPAHDGGEEHEEGGPNEVATPAPEATTDPATVTETETTQPEALR